VTSKTRSDDVAGNPAITSPCIGLCRIDEASGLCEGCYRTLAEIAGWTSMGEEERERVRACLRRRAAR